MVRLAICGFPAATTAESAFAIFNLAVGDLDEEDQRYSRAQYFRRGKAITKGGERPGCLYASCQERVEARLKARLLERLEQPPPPPVEPTPAEAEAAAVPPPPPPPPPNAAPSPRAAGTKPAPPIPKTVERAAFDRLFREPSKNRDRRENTWRESREYADYLEARDAAPAVGSDETIVARKNPLLDFLKTAKGAALLRKKGAAPRKWERGKGGDVKKKSKKKKGAADKGPGGAKPAKKKKKAPRQTPVEKQRSDVAAPTNGAGDGGPSSKKPKKKKAPKDGGAPPKKPKPKRAPAGATA